MLTEVFRVQTKQKKSSRENGRKKEIRYSSTNIFREYQHKKQLLKTRKSRIERTTTTYIYLPKTTSDHVIRPSLIRQPLETIKQHNKQPN